MEVYIEKPTKEQLDLLSHLFQSWFERGRANLLHHAFEILESHESQDIRLLVLDLMKTFYPNNQKGDILELWITHPLPIMREFIKEIVDTQDLDIPVKVAIYVMLDEFEQLMDLDPDFHHLDSYIRTVDPLLGSLLIQKVEQLKNPELNLNILPQQGEEELSLIDRIRKRDFSYLWENILDYPLPFVAELLSIFHEEEWKPVDQSGSELFEILIEEVGTKGWFEIEDCKWVVLSKKRGNSFEPVTASEIERGDFQLVFSQDLIARPDRILSQKFKSRGRFAITNSELGLNIYLETIRRSEFDGLLHIPIYSANGVELTEFTIPVSSDKNFVMDDDGLYFSVRNKQGTYTIDLDALAAFLLPISRHTEMINDMVPILIERATERQKMPLRALNMLSTMHRGREFGLWDLKKVDKWDDDFKESLKADHCLCTLGIDIGNATTKVSLVINGTCEHELQNWEFPTIIYYNSVVDYIVGQEVLDKKLQNTSQTFHNIKNSLKLGSRKYLRIQNSIVTSYDAYRDYLFSIIEQVENEIGFTVGSVGITFPLHSPSGFEAWLRSILQEKGIPRIELIDELSASVLGSYRLHNQRGNVIIIDIGSSQIGTAISQMLGNKSRKRTEDTRMRENFELSPEIISKVSLDRGSLEISELMYSTIIDEQNFYNLFFELETAKYQLSKNFQAKLSVNEKKYNFSMNVNEGINIEELFTKSELFHAFKVLLRNVMVKANLRGVSKDDIETVLILGAGSQWPPFLEYINRIFKEKEIIIEDDRNLTAKGVGLLANGQSIEMRLEEDILLKVAKNGIVGYETVAERGESLIGKSKQFEIRPHTRMKHIVLDCWVRRPQFIPNEDIQPMKDGNNSGHGSESRNLFTYDRLFREIVDLDGDATLKLNISSRGTLYYEIETKNTSQLILTGSSVY